MLRKLEKYEVLEEIGHGGMATVWKARDERLDRLVAIKVLHPHLRNAKEARERFTREAQSVARLKHRNILEIYDYSGEDSEESYIAAELLTGPTLKRLVEDSPITMPAEVAAAFVIEIAEALGAAHKSGIVHRDVKPENVLVHEDRCIKLTDFGIAQMVDSQSFTATGQILGSPGHMAPEQIEGGECDERSDLFALGTVLYYLAVGRLPFTGKNPHQVLKRIVDGDFPDPLRVEPSIGGPFRRIVVKALAHAPADRYQSATELADALRAFMATIGLDDPPALVAQYLSDPPGTADRLRRETVEALVGEGRRALEADDVATALDHFNRVLALDEGNEQVLRLIERIGQRGQRRRALVLAASGVALLALVIAVGFGVAGGGGSTAARPDAGPLVITPEPPDAGIALDAARARLPDARAVVEVAEVRDAGPRDTGLSANPNAGPTKAPVLRPAAPRLVRFNPSVPDVEIGIDGAPPRSFEQGFTSAELRGRVEVFVRSLNPCCRDVRRTVTIPAGDGPYTLALPLPFEAARVLVSSSPTGDLVIAGAGDRPSVRGRTNGVLLIPMGSAEEDRVFAVTAEGHGRYEGHVRLRAGGLTAPERVVLRPLDP